jgi:hypothetical protein
VRFKRDTGDWTKYRGPGVLEVDFHRADPNPRACRVGLPFHETMEQVRTDTLEALKTAQQRGYEKVLFRHGWSTSRRGRTSSRSVVRGVMRSKDATPYIVRKPSVEHPSVFVAAIRPIAPDPE